MKKVLLTLLVILLVLVGAGFIWYNSAYGGTSYYVKIVADGKKEQVTADDGTRFYRWTYVLNAYDENGSEKKMEFTADHNLKHNAYLNLTYNATKGVTSWAEVDQKDVPQKARDKLDSH